MSTPIKPKYPLFNKKLNDISDKLNDISDKLTSGDISSNKTGNYKIENIDLSLRAIGDRDVSQLTLKPNVYYNINHEGSIFLNFSSSQEYTNTLGDYVGLICKTDDPVMMEFVPMLTIPGLIVKNDEIEGFHYKEHIAIYGGSSIDIYYYNNPVESKENHIKLVNSPISELEGYEFDIYDTKILDEIFTIAAIFQGIIIIDVCFEYINQDEDGYHYKTYFMGEESEYIAAKPIEAGDVGDMDGISTLALYARDQYIDVNELCEYVFSFNTPCEIISTSNELYFNNGIAPDLTQEGVVTISIVNGLACWTFKPN